MSIVNNTDGKYLYKYLPFNQYSLQMLINQKFYLSSPDLLNDPFEGDFVISNYLELCNPETFEFLLNVSTKDSNSFIDKIHKESLIKSWNEDELNFQQNLYEYLSNIIKKQFGTTSFSKTCNSIKMWSHYADSHKGFVVVFDREILSTSCLFNNLNLAEVKYDSVPKVSVRKDDLALTNDSELFIHKLPSWKKENEVRIIKKYWRVDGFQSDLSRQLDFPHNSIVGIIYGSRMTPESILTLEHLFNQQNKKVIKRYFAHKNRERDKVIFTEIDTKKRTRA